MQQRIVFTPLPNGTASTSTVKLSVAISLQVRGDKDAILDDVKDMLNWAFLISNSTFYILVNDKEVAAVKPAIGDDTVPGINQSLWQSLFTKKIIVRPFEPEADKLLGMPLRSYPVKHITGFLEKVIGDIGLSHSNTMPVATDLTNHPGLKEISMYGVKEIPTIKEAPLIPQSLSEVVDEKDGGITRVTRQLYGNRYIEFDKKPNPSTDFAQLRLFHGVYSKPAPDVPYVQPITPDFEFHDILSVVASYPQLMRNLGLVIDLEFSAPTGMADAGTIRVIPGGLALTANTDIVCPATRYKKEGSGFYVDNAANSNISKGYLSIAKETDDAENFTVYQIDADGGGLKTGQMIDGLQLNAASQTFSFLTANSAIPEQKDLYNYGNLTCLAGRPTRKEGLPAQRTAGIAIALNGLGGILRNKFTAASNMESLSTLPPALLPKLTTSPNITYKQTSTGLMADDVTLGYRMDVKYRGNWHSLHDRVNHYNNGMEPLRMPLPPDEGFIQLSATQGEDDIDNNGIQPYLKVGETIARWEGWSLSVPKPGKAIKDRMMEKGDGELVLVDHFDKPGTKGFELNVTSGLVPGPGKLPRLRFGETYAVRLRTVDLAGNSIPLSAEPGNAAEVVHEGITHRRYEPVATPILTMGNTIKDGESVEQVVISSEGMEAVRYVKPPRTHVQMAEHHGMLDVKMKENPAALYETIAHRDPELLAPPVHATPVETVCPTTIDYLADPMAAGVTFFVSEDDPNLPKAAFAFDFLTRRITFYPKLNNNASLIDPKVTNAASMFSNLDFGTWMDPRCFKIKLVAANTVTLEWKESDHTLEVGLQPGFMLRLSYSCFWWKDGIQQQSGIMHILSKRIQEVPDANALLVKIERGRHWMFSPWRDITFVHAVQQPVLPPVIHVIKPSREAGSTTAQLAMHLTIHSQSTSQVDLECQWLEWVDDPTKPEVKQWLMKSKVAHFTTQYAVDEYRLGSTGTQYNPIAALQHQLGDTKHRMIDYKAFATTRYREYFIEAMKVANARGEAFPLTRESSWFMRVNIPSSARPLAPEVAYVIPSFEWGREADGKITKTGRASALRVYLRRPWYSSGEGEQLAVVLFPFERGKMIPGAQVDWFTTWGTDPTKISAELSRQPELQIAPSSDFCIGNVAKEAGVGMAEKTGLKADVAMYDVKYDAERRLYYADVMLNIGAAYTPFVRLALARYQKNSVKNEYADCRLSPVTLSEYIQIPSPRFTAIEFHNQRNDFTITISGTIPKLAENQYINRFDIFVDDAEVPVSDGAYIGRPYFDKEPHLAFDNHLLDSGNAPEAAFLYQKKFNATDQGFTKLEEYAMKPFRVRILEYESTDQAPNSFFPGAYKNPKPERLVFAEVYEVGIGSPLTAYTTGTTHHIVYRDHNNMIQEFSGNTTNWSRNNLLLTASNRPPVSGTPFGHSSHQDNVNVQHVAYRRGFNICELQAGNTWEERDITKLTNAPMAIGNPSSFTTAGTNSTKIVYRDLTGKINILWSEANWQKASLSDLTQTPASALAAGDPSAYLSHNDTNQHVVYRDQDGHVQELWAVAQWFRNNLTVNANIPANALADSDPVGYTTNNATVQRVIYAGRDGHIYELCWTGASGWHHGNLTALAGLSGLLLPAGKLSPYVTGNTNVPHIVYRGRDNYIHELWMGDGGWAHNNLTLASGNAIRPAGDPVGYVSTDGTVQSQNVVYYGADGKLHKLSAGAAWVHSVIEAF